MGETYLDKVYKLDGVEETIDFYDEWAASYDAEVTEHGYITPARCARALAGIVEDKATPILDFGCGTGLSGQALADAGFTVIDGTDLSDGMLEVARARGVYRNLWKGSIEKPFGFEPGTYPVIAAIGVIGTGAAPADTAHAVVDHLGPGGLFLLSLNDHALAEPEFDGALKAEIAKGRLEEIHRDYGPHLPKLGLNSDAIVLRRL